MNNRNMRRGLVRRGRVKQGLLYQRVPGGRTVYDVPMDGPDSVYVPADAQDWLDIPGLVAPWVQWNCDEASGNLTSDIGSKTLTAANAGHLYQQTITGWGTKAVGFAAGATGSFYTTDVAFDVAEDESFCWLIYVAVTPSTASRPILYAGTHLVESVGGGGTSVRIRRPGGVNAGTASYNVATVTPMLFGRNCTAGTLRLFTSLEQINGTYSNAAIAADYGIGGLGAAAELSRYMRVCMWKGADAETMLSRTTLIKLGWSLPY